MAYHYPQQSPNGAPGQRQGLSSLEPAAPQAPEFAAYPNPQHPTYGQQAHAQQRGFGPAGNPDPHAAGHQGYRPAAPAPYGNPAGPGYDQWQSPELDPRGPNYDLGGYLPAGRGAPAGAPVDPMQQPDWVHQGHAGYNDASLEAGYQAAAMGGYEQQPHTGALEQSYAEEHAEYEAEETRRGSWALRIAGAIVVAIGMGYGLAQGYKLVVSPASDVATPVVKNDSEPARTEPADPGGKQFAHTDSKIMDRLEDGPNGTPPATPAAAETDETGARKVSTLVVGRDGSIAPPAAPAEAPAATVPGVTMVDGYGGRYPSGEPSSPPPAEQQQVAEAQPSPPAAPPPAPKKPIVVKPPATAAAESKPVTVAKADAGDSPGDITQEAMTPEKPAAHAVKKMPPPTTTAALPSTGAEPAAAPAGAAGGYVVVLASVPASGDSRLVALKRFADMQQKYGSVLQNKTPDVREANLGEKGVYHRLLVGPPASRTAANQLCTDLKAAGYKDCWVTAY